MSMTDPIADMLTRLRNAHSAYHDTVGMPYSKIKSHIAEILHEAGYIAGWRAADAEAGRNVVVILELRNPRQRCIAGLKPVPNAGRRVRARHGLSRPLAPNRVTGATHGYRKTLEIVGVGYRAQAKGSDLEFSLGFSHPVVVNPPEGISFRVEAPTRFVVEGIDK